MQRIALLISLAVMVGCAHSVSPESSQPTESMPFVASSQVSSIESEVVIIPEIDRTDWRLILVNYENPLPEDFTVKLGFTNQAYAVDERIVPYWEEMYAAAKADGVELLLCYGFRTLAESNQLFEKQINRQMLNNGYTREEAIEAAKRVVAPPGYSEHHTGLALDIVTPSHQVLNANFAKTDAAIWLAENAYRFGFILRYPLDKQEITRIIFEPWHYRFVGHEAAKIMFDEGLCLEEYLMQ